MMIRVLVRGASAGALACWDGSVVPLSALDSAIIADGT